MKKLSYLLIIALFLGVINGLKAQDPCPFDQHLYQDEQKLVPELTEFLSGKRYVLPEGSKVQGFGIFKYNPELLLKILSNEAFILDDYTRNLSDDEKAFLTWVVDYTRNRKDTRRYLLLPDSIPYQLGPDWRMRGQKSQRPNDPKLIEFKIRKASVFKDEMSEKLEIKRDSEILTPINFVGNMFELIKGVEYSDFSKFNEYKAELFYCFGEVLAITGLKHNAFRAYLKSADLTKDNGLHGLAVVAAREIKQSHRGDFDKFEDDFLAKQNDEALKFNAAFTEFAKTHPDYTDFKALKTAFLESYGKSNSLSIVLLMIFGVLVIALLIFFSKKSVTG